MAQNLQIVVPISWPVNIKMIDICICLSYLEKVFFLKGDFTNLSVKYKRGEKMGKMIKNSYIRTSKTYL